MGTHGQPTFYYDLASAWCYLAAESVNGTLAVVPEWEPVLAEAVGPVEADPDRGRVEQLAAQLGLQPLRWPPSWPPDSRLAMLAATYAKQIGRTVAFSLAAFRQGFAGGRELGAQETVLIAGAACEMHPTALLKGIALRSIAERLELASARARQAGVSTLPAIQAAGRVFQGETAVEQAACELAVQR